LKARRSAAGTNQLRIADASAVEVHAAIGRWFAGAIRTTYSSSPDGSQRLRGAIRKR
jgi:hypothetical protein